ncbi:protein neprosin [Quercus suber]|uniref:protein neprosin n=1 Tax=Quercus suber TaxID=58331 RepID=UPI0032DF94FA
MLANMNVWNPKTMDSNEFSISQFWMTAGDSADFDTIEAGITVDDNLYGDYQTRLFTYWTVCVLIFDFPASTSHVYIHYFIFEKMMDIKGQVAAIWIALALFKSTTRLRRVQPSPLIPAMVVTNDIDGNGDWWLRIAERDFGYWPSSLFSLLSNSASSVQWGGEVTNIMLGDKHTTTQMGSGHFPEEGPGKASFFNTLNVIDGKTVQRPPWNSHTVITNPNCYNLIVNSEDFFYYGGPGRNPNCP